MQNFENNFYNFLEKNCNKNFSDEESEKYKIGVSGIDFLENTNPNILNIFQKSRFLYLKNLCSKEFSSFYVPNELFLTEQALMYASFEDFDSAFNVLNLNLQYELIGAEAISSAGNSYLTTVLDIQGTSDQSFYDYKQDYSTFKNFKVHPLNVFELIHLYVKILQIISTEDNSELKESYVSAFIKRALFELTKDDIHNNDNFADDNNFKESNNFADHQNFADHKNFIDHKNFADHKNFIDHNNFIDSNNFADHKNLECAFRLLYCNVFQKSFKLEKFTDQKIDHKNFNLPIIFKFDLYLFLGTALMNELDYSGAYNLFKNYMARNERIKCLLAMKEHSKCAEEIQSYIEKIGEPTTRESRMILSNLNVKLGHIYQNPSYYDVASQIFVSDVPFKAKGYFYYCRKMYNEACYALEQALALVPENEELLYNYGCVLLELDRIKESLKIFKKLKLENPQSINISKNLSLCYYKLEDIENTLSTMASVARNDQTMLKQYFLISVKNSLKENICWALKLIRIDSVVKEACNYIVVTQILTKEELLNILSENVYFDKKIFT